jgi:hypothetical protein
VAGGEQAWRRLAGVDQKRCSGDGSGRGLAWEREEVMVNSVAGLGQRCGCWRVRSTASGSRGAPASNYTHGRERGGGGNGAGGDARPEAKLQRWS